MQKRPLILSTQWDVQAAAVCWGLRKNGIEPCWTTFSEQPDGPVSLHSNQDLPWRLQGAFNPEKISSVWLHRPRKPKHFPNARACDEPHLRAEWSRLYDNLYAVCPDFGDTLWVNQPVAAAQAENKLLQLQVARKCGLAFPETLVSNHPGDVRRFIQRHGRVIYKGFGRYTWKDSVSGELYAQWVDTLDTSSVLDDRVIKLSPGTYQPVIKKQYDLRVTVIGERLFTIRLKPLAQGACVDWRQDALTQSIDARVYPLPAAIEDKISRLMNKLGIVYGCIDLLVDTAGDMYFLEVNQAGAFSFVEDMVGSLPLLRSMCAMLKTGRTDYSLDAITGVAYHDYLESEAFSEWQARVNASTDPEERIGGVFME